MLEKYVLAGLIHFGFADLDRLREVSKSDALLKPLNDEYVPKLEQNIWFWLSWLVMRGDEPIWTYRYIFLEIRIRMHTPCNKLFRTYIKWPTSKIRRYSMAKFYFEDKWGLPKKKKKQKELYYMVDKCKVGSRKCTPGPWGPAPRILNYEEGMSYTYFVGNIWQ